MTRLFKLPSYFFKLSAVTVTLLAGAALAPLAHSFGVGVQPATVEMTIKPGENQRQVITIGNVHKEKTISLTISLADWTLDDEGELRLSAPGETERSAADWVRFSPAIVILKPETKQEINVEITAPFKLENTGDHRFALLATTRLPEDREGRSGVWNRYQLASLFYLTSLPAESLPKVETTLVADGAQNILTVDIDNPGDAHARLRGNVNIKDTEGELVYSHPFNSVVLDGKSRQLNIALDAADGVVPGEDYNVEFDINNAFVPQNQFKPKPISVAGVSFKAK